MAKTNQEQRDAPLQLGTVDFVESTELGIESANSPDNAGLVVRKFLESADEGPVPAAARRKVKIHVGDFPTHISMGG
jgi:hypothetical protein